MRILVTNDDGISEPGLRMLAQTLVDDGHDVIAVAPLTERSGSGSAIGSIEHGASIETRQVDIGVYPGIEAFGIDAPPGLAVLAAASGQFGPPPQLVVSGINPGHNVGRSVLFSGTVGAVLAAATLEIPGIAVSCGFAPTHRFDTAATLATTIVGWFAENDMPVLSVNVNVPDLDLADIDGCVITRLARRSLFSVRMQRDGEILTLHRAPLTDKLDIDTDTGAVAAGMASVSVLRPMSSADEAVGDEIAHRIRESIAAITAIAAVKS